MSYYDSNNLERDGSLRRIETDPVVEATARTRRAQGLAAEQATRRALEALGGLLPVTPATLREVTVEPVAEEAVMQPRIVEDSPEFIGPSITLQDTGSTTDLGLAGQQALIDQHRDAINAIHDGLQEAA